MPQMGVYPIWININWDKPFVIENLPKIGKIEQKSDIFSLVIELKMPTEISKASL